MLEISSVCFLYLEGFRRFCSMSVDSTRGSNGLDAT